MPPVRSATWTSRGTPGPPCPGTTRSRPPRRWPATCAASCPQTSGSGRPHKRRRASTPASPRCCVATPIGSATTPRAFRRFAGATSCTGRVHWTSRAWTRPARPWSGCTTSRPSAGSGTAPRRCGPCSSTPGPGTPTGSSSPGSWPTPSATRWSAPSSAVRPPWARDGVPRPGWSASSPAASGIPPWSSPQPTGWCSRRSSTRRTPGLADRARQARARRGPPR